MFDFFNHIGIETGNRSESELIKFKRYPTLVTHMIVSRMVSVQGFINEAPEEEKRRLAQRQTCCALAWSLLRVCFCCRCG